MASSCSSTPGKTRYPDHATAMRILRKIWRTNSSPGALPCRAYLCQACGGYHLTSRPRTSGV